MQTQLQSQTTPAPTSLYQIQLTPEASHGHVSVQGGGGGGHTSYKVTSTPSDHHQEYTIGRGRVSYSVCHCAKALRWGVCTQSRILSLSCYNPHSPCTNRACMLSIPICHNPNDVTLELKTFCPTTVYPSQNPKFLKTYTHFAILTMMWFHVLELHIITLHDLLIDFLILSCLSY